MNTTIYLVRHCQYHNPRNVIPFRLPGFPLSETGRKCAQDLGESFAHKAISHIFTSPLTRAKQTATIIGKKLEIKPIISDLIIETRTPLQGMDKNLFDAGGGDALTHPIHIKNHGETATEIFTRVKQFVDEVINLYPGKNSLIVFHGDPIMLISQGLKKELLTGSVDSNYIPMGGIFKLVFNGKLLDSFEQVFPLIS